jgi:hypothetical protein
MHTLIKKKKVEVIALEKILTELQKAEEKFPGFPKDIIHCSAILAEECGEVSKAAIDYYYGGPSKHEELRVEIAQAGALALRFLIRMLDSRYYPEQKV